jgi:hypothetical protein
MSEMCENSPLSLLTTDPDTGGRVRRSAGTSGKPTTHCPFDNSAVETSHSITKTPTGRTWPNGIIYMKTNTSKHQIRYRPLEPEHHGAYRLL